MSKRKLTPEEKALWKLVTRGDKTLSGYTEEEPVRIEEKTKPCPLPKVRRQAPPASAKMKDEFLTQGHYAGVDARTAERFRKGQYAIDVTLDLHGFTRAKAEEAFEQCVKWQYEKGRRCLLVVTGKGAGVLRQAFPAWVNLPGIKEYILAYDVAKTKHGGSGAYYVLLKRRRPQ